MEVTLLLPEWLAWLVIAVMGISIAITCFSVALRFRLMRLQAERDAHVAEYLCHVASYIAQDSEQDPLPFIEPCWLCGGSGKRDTGRVCDRCEGRGVLAQTD